MTLISDMFWQNASLMWIISDGVFRVIDVVYISEENLVTRKLTVTN
jgi:hypothetical protein